MKIKQLLEVYISIPSFLSSDYEEYWLYLDYVEEHSCVKRMFVI